MNKNNEKSEEEIRREFEMINMKEDRNLYLGDIHSHNDMSVFFSQVDIDELIIKASQENFLSLIVNNKDEMVGKLAVICHNKNSNNLEYEVNDIYTEETFTLYKKKIHENLIITYDCNIIKENAKIDSSLEERVQELLDKKKKEDIYKFNRYNNNYSNPSLFSAQNSIYNNGIYANDNIYNDIEDTDDDSEGILVLKKYLLFNGSTYAFNNGSIEDIIRLYENRKFYTKKMESLKRRLENNFNLFYKNVTKDEMLKRCNAVVENIITDYIHPENATETERILHEFLINKIKELKDERAEI